MILLVRNLEENVTVLSSLYLVWLCFSPALGCLLSFTQRIRRPSLGSSVPTAFQGGSGRVSGFWGAVNPSGPVQLSLAEPCENRRRTWTTRIGAEYLVAVPDISRV